MRWFKFSRTKRHHHRKIVPQKHYKKISQFRMGALANASLDKGQRPQFDRKSDYRAPAAHIWLRQRARQESPKSDRVRVKFHFNKSYGLPPVLRKISGGVSKAAAAALEHYKKVPLGIDPLWKPTAEIPGTTTICDRRGARRRALFVHQIAGRGRRKSPGAGGTYHRTPDSQASCREYRK